MQKARASGILISMKKEQPPKNRVAVVLGIVALVVLTIIGLAVISAIAMQKTSTSNLTENRTSVVNLRGESVCLPQKEIAGEEVQTQECVYGLKVSDDIHYGLTGLEQHEGDAATQTGDLITVTGTLTPPPEDSKYDIVGTIAVQSVRTQE